jgi:hypothetical protein
MTIKTKRASKKAAPIVAYKAFGPDWTCNPTGDKPFKYEVGKTYEHEGKVDACSSGFHACEYPLHVLRYYSAATSIFAVVEQSGDIARHGDDSKIASSRIKVVEEIGLPGLIKAAIEYTTSRCKPVDPKSPAYSDKANGAATASGESGAATASGESGAATASGRYGAATASGESGAATASGRYGAATASGESGAATASGWCGAATASGESGAAIASGVYGAATASGESGAATASGESGAATASGWCGAATANHATAAAMASGYNGKARGVKGAMLALSERDNDGNILNAWAGIVGRDGIKPDTFYTLKNGKPIEVTP